MAWLEDIAIEGKLPNVSEYLIASIGDRMAKGKTVPLLFAKKPKLLQDLRTHTLLDIEYALPATFFAKSNGSLDDVLPQREGDYGVRFSVSPPPLPPQSSSPPLEYVAVPHARQRHLLLPEDLNPPIPSLDANGRIPSSSSPSPMKLPPRSDARLTAEPSPTRCCTRATSSPKQRKGKRPQPQPRSEVQSRQESRETITRESSARLTLPPQPMCYEAIILLNGSARLSEDSLRMTCEDPGQEAEKRKLTALLGEESLSGINGVVVTWVVAIDPPGVRFPLNALRRSSLPRQRKSAAFCGGIPTSECHHYVKTQLDRIIFPQPTGKNDTRRAVR
ncbi:hypothetical protein DFH29DRAFT_872782 [Suillus ampliporus]|nr:hypothetical protein DFH29DRAFT_872782 [Suillus ampliporus]